MKLLVIGYGQCGGRIADEFARQNRLAHTQRGISIITGALAVNTDTTERGVQAMNQAISTLSLNCNPEDAKRALYLLTAPPGEMTMDMIRQNSSYLKRIVPEAIIRSGDYPRGKTLDVTVVLSEFINSRKVMDYFNKVLRYTYLAKRRRGGIEYEHTGIEGNLSDIPSLL